MEPVIRPGELLEPKPTTLNAMERIIMGQYAKGEISRNDVREKLGISEYRRSLLWEIYIRGE